MENVLIKKYWRSDTLWTIPFIYKSPLRHIALYFDTRALMKSQYAPREAIRRIQDEQMARLFKRTRSVPFWKALFESHSIDTLSPVRQILAQLPVTGKSSLTLFPLKHVADISQLPRSEEDHTSGSTGRPLHFNQDWRSVLRSCAVTERTFRTMTGGTRYPIVYMRTRERHGFTFYKHVWFYLRGYNSVQYRMDDFKALGQKFPGGFILYGYTSWVLELARWIEVWGIELPIKSVMVAGEHCTPLDREYMSRVFKAPVYSMYASREVGFLAYECEQHAMHVNEEWALIEIVDRDGLPVPDGEEGRIIVTTFDNYVMPFIRYEVGDIGSLSNVPCPCGRTLQTIAFKGRSIELIDVGDGRTVSLLDVAYVLGKDRRAVLQYQIIQTALRSFTIKIVPGPRYSDHRQFYLELLLIRLLHPSAVLRWEMAEAIPEALSGKAVYFIRDFEKTA